MALKQRDLGSLKPSDRSEITQARFTYPVHELTQESRLNEHVVRRSDSREKMHSFSANDSNLIPFSYNNDSSDIWIQRTDIKVNYQSNNSNNHKKSLGIKPWVSKSTVSSPRPFIPPKPRRYSDGCCTEDNSRPIGVKRVTGPIQKSPKNILVSDVNPSVPSYDVTSLDYVAKSSTLPRKVKTSQNNQFVARSSSLKRNKIKNTEMDSPQIKQPLYKLDARKIPPKIATKPKLRSVNEPSSVPNPSEVRNKFEDMKIQFKKPVKDEVFNTLRNSNGNQPITQTANELFKDILEMKDLDGFMNTLGIEAGDSLNESNRFSIPQISDEIESDSSEPVGNGNYEYINETWDLDFENVTEKVSSPSSLKDLKSKFESEFESKVINSLISPTEKKKFFQQAPQRPVRSSSLEEHQKNNLHNLNSTHSDVDHTFLPPPNPIKFGIEFDDLPAPNLPPPPTNITLSTSRHNAPDSVGLKAERTTANQSSVHYNKDTSLGVSAANISHNSRTLDEEILYYDNMDIMEKVSQRKQQEILSNLPSNSKPSNSTPAANQNSSEIDVKSTDKQSITNNKQPDATKLIKSEFKNAMPDLKNQKIDPPKLPPKQRKLKPDTSKKTPQLSLKLNIPTQTAPVSKHVLTPMPSESAITFKPSTNQQPTMPIIPTVSPEEIRARSLVDEPLAPIMEEDVQYSSCASSIAGDTASIASLQSKTMSGSIASLNSPQKNENDVELFDGEVTETDTPEVFLSSCTTVDSGSETVSLKWNSHPLINNSNSTQSPDNNASNFASKEPAASNEGVYEFMNDNEIIGSVNDRKSLIREISRDSGSSISSYKSGSVRSSSENRESSLHSSQKDMHNQLVHAEEGIIYDVEPYGMVDLTNLDHSFKESAQFESCDDPDNLTPLGIMTQVNEFNTLPKQPKPLLSPILDDNLPNFPMNVDVSTNQRDGVFNQYGQFEEVGYDNLENYGGSARKTAELKTKYAQSTKKKNEQAHGFDNNHKTKGSRGSAQKETQPGNNLQFPVSTSHLSRHSSAVSALDRHSGNLKRNNSEPRKKTKVRSLSDKKGPSTLPRIEPEVRQRNDAPTRSKSSEKITDLPPEIDTTQQDIENFQPFPVGKSDFDETLDDGVLNPYEEVPFLIDAPLTQLPPDTDEQKEAKHRVHEILKNIKPPESPYKPKPPLPRYPVEYDNFYLGETKSRNGSGVATEERTKPGSSSSIPSSPSTDTKTSRSLSTDGLSDSRDAKTRTLSTGSDITADAPKQEDNSSDANSKSLGSQLRSLLGSTPESKYISPSLRRKRSLLKRSKSPGGSRRAKSPASTKSEQPPEELLQEEEKEDNKSLKSAAEQEEGPKKRSASQRIVDRRGRAPRSSFRKSKASGDESTDTLERKSKSRMWRRSKSTDRESPTRSKSKERKLKGFGRRSKSSERPNPPLESKGEIDIGERGRSTRSSFFRRSRSSSRKREGGAKTAERNKEEGGRNPVNFFKKLLRNKKEEEDEIIHLPLGTGVDLSDSSEALSTILAYKGDEVVEGGRWTPPRPNPPTQQTPASNSKKGKSKSKNKPMKSPPSHRKKILSNRSKKTERSTGSSSEGNAKASNTYGNMGPNRSFLSPQKPIRKNSFSNSVPSSDSDSISRSKENMLLLNGAKNRLLQQQDQRSPSLRRNLLLNREYDSDTTSVLPSDPDSSTGIQSDAEITTPRSAMKQPGALSRIRGQFKGSPRRPVRVISGGRSKSDPSLFVEDGDPKNTYYNLESDVTPKNATSLQDKKRPTPNKRRSQKQNRRQTAPVDLVFATHQRQKYRTLVSLNAQTLRKVTERWLSEWRNSLPVGGFLITSWSDIGLSSHRPLCMIGNSVVYGAVPTGNNKYNLACQLYDQQDIDDRMLRNLDHCASLPSHPNTCGVCSHFACRVPRSLLDPNSRGGAADAICVVLSSRPQQSLQENLDDIVLKEDPTEYHRQLLLSVLQLLQGVKHLMSSGFDLQTITSEHLVIAEKTGFLQILPHLQWKSKRPEFVDSTDSDASSNRATIPQQISRVVKRLLHNGTLQTLTGGLGGVGDRNSSASAVSRVIVPGTKYSPAVKRVIRHLQNPQVTVLEATELVQCALWGPEDIDDLGADDVTPYSALELWLEMEQAKLVNSLAVLMPDDRLSPASLLKHQYFATVSPDVLFKALKTLQRI